MRHQDSLWSDQVNLWRDCLPPALVRQLEGGRVGDLATVAIEADRFHAPYRKNLQVLLPKKQLYAPGRSGQEVIPQPGRFYPQGYLHGLCGVFEASTAPARYQDQPTEFFATKGLQRADSTDDADFYARPRLVHHRDSTVRATISTQYGALIPPGARVLNLMASWDSHLPDTLDISSLTVLGLNSVELAANTRASQRIIQDLNQKPQLPFADNSFDAIVCTASIEYLRTPLEQFQELRRILAPGGILVVSFSNRWFPPKTIRIWSELHPYERMAMVLEMFHRTPGLTELHTLSRRGEPRPEDDPHQEIPWSDPVFLVWGRKER